MTLVEVFAVALITLHSPGGHEIDINGNEVSSLRDTDALPAGHVVKGVRCLLFMTNSKVIAVTETCDEARHLIESSK